jgi:lysophospholipid acyltransferase (LPLAT)-like uncharacterized protein
MKAINVMKLNRPWMLETAALLAVKAAQIVLATLDFRAISCNPTTDPLHPNCDRRYLYITWHECVVVGLPLRAHAGMLGIASGHRDGELLNQSASRLGWEMVRGSTNRDAVSALKQLLREDDRHLNIAPDGPRGPRREMSQGAIYLASKSGLPLICCAYGFDRPRRLKSWDRCIIPRPFSRARAIYGPPLVIPPRLDRSGIEHYRNVLERLLNRLTLEAEEWAESGEAKPREFRLTPRGTSRPVASAPDQFRTPLSSEATRLVQLLEDHESTSPSLRKAA